MVTFGPRVDDWGALIMITGVTTRLSRMSRRRSRRDAWLDDVAMAQRDRHLQLTAIGPLPDSQSRRAAMNGVDRRKHEHCPFTGHGVVRGERDLDADSIMVVVLVGR